MHFEKEETFEPDDIYPKGTVRWQVGEKTVARCGFEFDECTGELEIGPLRDSLKVEEAYRGRGLGVEVTRAAIRHARDSVTGPITGISCKVELLNKHAMRTAQDAGFLRGKTIDRETIIYSFDPAKLKDL